MATIFSELAQVLSFDEPRFEAWARPAAVLVLLAQTPEPSVLLIHRPDTLTHHAGQIACPGGSFDHCVDTTLWDTARRETREEVGIDVPWDSHLGHLDPVYIPVTDFTLLPYVVALDARPEVHPDAGEVASYQWVGLNELRRVRRMSRVMAAGAAYQMPEFPLTWGRLWGATARVMDQLLAKLDGQATAGDI